MQEKKLDRRGAIGLLLAAGILTARVAPAQGKIAAHINLDDYESFSITFKGKRETFSTADVYDALFGAGKFA